MKRFENVWFIAAAFCFALVLALGTGCGKDKPKDSGGSAGGPAAHAPAGGSPSAPAGAPDAGQAGKSSGGDMTAYHYVMEGSHPVEGKNRIDMKVADGGKKTNVQMSHMENGQWVVDMYMISDGQFSYLMDPKAKTAIKAPINEEAMENMPEGMMEAPTWDSFLEQTPGVNASEKGSETINGVKTKVYEISMEGNVAKYYVDSDNIIRRISGKEEGVEGEMVMDVVTFDKSPKFSEADFTPPAGYQIMDMSKMMEGMGMPEGMELPEGVEMPDMPQ